MQTGKNAAASMKETAANVAASAKSGMEKTKASAQEKVCRCSFLVRFFLVKIEVIMEREFFVSSLYKR